MNVKRIIWLSLALACASGLLIKSYFSIMEAAIPDEIMHSGFWTSGGPGFWAYVALYAAPVYLALYLIFIVTLVFRREINLMQSGLLIVLPLLFVLLF